MVRKEAKFSCFESKNVYSCLYPFSVDPDDYCILLPENDILYFCRIVFQNSRLLSFMQGTEIKKIRYPRMTMQHPVKRVAEGR